MSPDQSEPARSTELVEIRITRPKCRFAKCQLRDLTRGRVGKRGDFGKSSLPQRVTRWSMGAPRRTALTARSAQREPRRRRLDGQTTKGCYVSSRRGAPSLPSARRGCMSNPSDSLIRAAPPLGGELRDYLARHRAALMARLAVGEDGI